MHSTLLILRNGHMTFQPQESDDVKTHLPIQGLRNIYCIRTDQWYIRTLQISTMRFFEFLNQKTTLI